MVSVLVMLSQAMLCLGGDCHPVLVGTNTPTGSYIAIKTGIDDPLYDYKFTVFAKDTKGNHYGIHPVWKGEPRRSKIIKYGTDASRIMTKGCINVESDVYDSLPDVFNLEILE